MAVAHTQAEPEGLSVPAADSQAQTPPVDSWVPLAHSESPSKRRPTPAQPSGSSLLTQEPSAPKLEESALEVLRREQQELKLAYEASMRQMTVRPMDGKVASSPCGPCGRNTVQILDVETSQHASMLIEVHESFGH